MQIIWLKKPVYNYMYSWNKRKQLNYVTWSILISTMNYDSANNEIFEWDKLYNWKTLLGEVLYDIELCEFRVKDISLNKILLKYRSQWTLIKGENKYMKEINSEREEIRSDIEETQDQAENCIRKINKLKEIIKQAQSDISEWVRDILWRNDQKSIDLEDDEYYYMTE